MALHSEPTAESMSHTDRCPRLVDSRCRGLRMDGYLIADDLGRHRAVQLVHSEVLGDVGQALHGRR